MKLFDCFIVLLDTTQLPKWPQVISWNLRNRFLAPFVAEPRLFRFTLRVTDVQGADSVPAVVDIMVEP